MGIGEASELLSRISIQGTIKPLEVFDLGLGLIMLSDQGGILPRGVHVTQVAPLYQIKHVDTSGPGFVHLCDFILLQDVVLFDLLLRHTVFEEPGVIWGWDSLLPGLKANEEIRSKLQCAINDLRWSLIWFEQGNLVNNVVFLVVRICTNRHLIRLSFFSATLDVIRHKGPQVFINLCTFVRLDIGFRREFKVQSLAFRGAQCFHILQQLCLSLVQGAEHGLVLVGHRLLFKRLDLAVSGVLLVHQRFQLSEPVDPRLAVFNSVHLLTVGLVQVEGKFTECHCEDTFFRVHRRVRLAKLFQQVAQIVPVV